MNSEGAVISWKPFKSFPIMPDLQEALAELLSFRDQRDWAQFHNPKDLALALSIEAAELNELFLWKQPEAADCQRVKEELADILSFALLLAHHYKFDPAAIIIDKLAMNNQKYPVEKSKGNAIKYTDL